MRLARYFTYYLFSFPLLICPFNYVAHVVGGSSQKARVHSRYRNYRTQFRKCTHFRYPNDNQLINPFQWLLYQKIMPVAYRLSEMVRKINNWPRKEALRANVKYWGLSLNQGSRSSKQPASQGLSISSSSFSPSYFSFRVAHTSRCTSASSGASWDCASILLTSGALTLIDTEYSASALSDGWAQDLPYAPEMLLDCALPQSVTSYERWYKHIRDCTL